MKHYRNNFLAAVPCVLSACMIAGCTENHGSSPEIIGEKVPVSISIPVNDLSASLSKVTTTDGEAAVNNVQVFVFRNDGVLDAYGKSETASVEVDCTVGEKNIVAVVNAPDLLNVTSLDGFNAAKSQLSDNSTGNFVMTGAKSATITSADNELTINVKRLVARVSISKITNALSAEQYAGTPIVINKIYLSNVAGDRLYSSASVPSLWLNMSGSFSDCPGLLSDSGISASIADGSSYTTPHYYYCYPNPTAEDSTAEIWSPRFTRLVVEASILGKTYYYPVSIGNIEQNHTYDIEELIITRLGSDDPDVPVSAGTISLTITVSDWEEGTSSTVTI